MRERRLASYQIEKHYKCRKCGMEQHPCGGYSAIMPCPQCKGYVELVSESYSGNTDNWDEKQLNDGSWINEQTGKWLGY